MNLGDKKTLCSFMSFVYRTMVASVPLLEFAYEKTDAPVLYDYYKKHIAEETGHVEMLRDDLRRLGIDEIPFSHMAAQFAGSQYYLIVHDHPAMLLGYMRALERESISPEQVDILSAHHGVTLTALKHHSIHDPQHKQDLDAVIDGLEEDLRQRVLWNESNIVDFMQRIDDGYR